jgi:hypothetical protein
MSCTPLQTDTLPRQGVPVAGLDPVDMIGLAKELTDLAGELKARAGRSARGGRSETGIAAYLREIRRR